jgi:hypothetical protein
MINIQSAVGNKPVVSNVQQRGVDPDARAPSVDVGVIAILSVEMRAVIAELQASADYGHQKFEGAKFHRSTIAAEHGPLRVAATRAASPGQRSAFAPSNACGDFAFREL